jgi:hypothetical protein
MTAPTAGELDIEDRANALGSAVPTLKPIRTYEVTVQGFPGSLYSARSPAKARVRCWYSYSSYRDVTFREFLRISSIKRIENPPGVGDRILVGGREAVRASGGNSHYVAFMRDDSDEVYFSHPLDVSQIPAAQSSKSETQSSGPTNTPVNRER